MARIAVLRAPGTNCDRETEGALREAGGDAVTVSISDLESGRSDLSRFAGLVIPGGFSYGDRVRAGAILAAKLKTSLRGALEEHVSRGRPVMGICNDFQVLVELGILPGIRRCGAALAPNSSARFESRWVRVRRTGRCPLAAGPDVQPLPVAHGEGRGSCRTPRGRSTGGRCPSRWGKPAGSRSSGRSSRRLPGPREFGAHASLPRYE
ncbi:MAG: phosphoribosylformylglycinamidine synthase subunit PurQ [Nitrososphaeria archaeon]